MFTTIRIITVLICKAGGNSRTASFPFSHKTASSIFVMESYIIYSVERGFSKCGTRNATGTFTSVY